jgi:hypothetical protein
MIDCNVFNPCFPHHARNCIVRHRRAFTRCDKRCQSRRADIPSAALRSGRPLYKWCIPGSPPNPPQYAHSVRCTHRRANKQAGQVRAQRVADLLVDFDMRVSFIQLILIYRYFLGDRHRIHKARNPPITSRSNQIPILRSRGLISLTWAEYAPWAAHHRYKCGS